MNKIKKTKKQLEHEIIELQAQLAHIYHYASQYISKLDKAHLMASGVMVTLHHLGGEEACPPFMIKDGLSKETITALKKDIKESYDLAVMFKPE